MQEVSKIDVVPLNFRIKIKKKNWIIYKIN